MNPHNKSNFTTNLLALNQLNNCGFKTWLLKPGMGFDEPDKWWGDRGARPTRHEGLDLTGFLDNANGEHQLTEGTIVPPLCRGRLVNIIDDFLGRTFIIDHGITNRQGQSLHGFYAHLIPTDKLKTGAILNEDEGLGSIAAGNHICPPHLHISTVWISRNFPVDQLSWADFTEQEGFQPCNPLVFL
jgi:hypothetical protein